MYFCHNITTMSTYANNELFQLVKSLTKSEKRLFHLNSTRLHGSKNKKFLLLFRYMDKQKKYDEKKFLAKEKAIKPVQIHNLKAHLQKQILQSLRQYHSAGNMDLKIRNLVDYSQL